MAFGTAARQQTRDEDSERVAQVVGEFEKLKGEISRLRERKVEDDKMIAVRDGEIAAMTREIAHLRYKMTFYQNAAAQMTASFGDCIAVMDRALQSAGDIAQQQADVEREHGTPELPVIDVPQFIHRMREENGIGQA